MANVLNLPSFSDGDDVHVVIETPRGSRAKYAFSPRLEAFALSKSLMIGLTYPYDWGFVPSTRGDDGDPLDIMVVHDATTFPGVVLACRVIGVLQIEQRQSGASMRNDRFFAVPLNSHAELALHDVQELSQPVQKELETFFSATEALEAKTLEFIGWKGPKAALQAIRDGNRTFAKSREGS